jgi:hypothetical protein
MKIVLLFIAACAGVWIWNHPLPQSVNEFIIAVFVTSGIYRNLRKLVENEK